MRPTGARMHRSTAEERDIVDVRTRRLIKNNAYDPASDTLRLEASQVAGTGGHRRFVGAHIPRRRLELRIPSRNDSNSGRAETDRPVLLLDRLGCLRRPSRNRSQLHEQLAFRPYGRKCRHDRNVYMEHRRHHLAVRDSRTVYILDSPRPPLVWRTQGNSTCGKTPGYAADLESDQGGEILPGRYSAASSSDDRSAACWRTTRCTRAAFIFPWSET